MLQNTTVEGKNGGVVDTLRNSEYIDVRKLGMDMKTMTSKGRGS